MKSMATEFFQGSDLMVWPLLALVLFIVVFAAAIVIVARRGAAAYEGVARLPLDSDDEVRS